MTCSYPGDLAKVETRVFWIKPVVEMDYEDSKITVFLDTGVSGRFMSEEIYLKRFSHINLEKFEGRICDVHSDGMEIVGKMKLRLNTEVCNVFVEVLVIRGVKLGGCWLLVHPAMLNNRISICPADCGIMIRGGGNNHFWGIFMGESTLRKKRRRG